MCYVPDSSSRVTKSSYDRNSNYHNNYQQNNGTNPIQKLPRIQNSSGNRPSRWYCYVIIVIITQPGTATSYMVRIPLFLYSAQAKCASCKLCHPVKTKIIQLNLCWVLSDNMYYLTGSSLKYLEFSEKVETSGKSYWTHLIVRILVGPLEHMLQLS